MISDIFLSELLEKRWISNWRTILQIFLCHLAQAVLKEHKLLDLYQLQPAYPGCNDEWSDDVHVDAPCEA